MDLLHTGDNPLPNSRRIAAAGHTDTGILVCDASGVILEAAEDIEQMSGFTGAELIGRHAGVIFAAPPDFMTSLLMAPADAGMNGVCCRDVTACHKDGATYHATLSTWRVQHDRYALRIVRATADAAANPAPLDHDAEHLRQLMLCLPVAVFECDMPGRIVFSNQRLGEILGYEPQEMRGMLLWELAASDAELAKLRHRCDGLAETQATAFNIDMTTRDRRVLTVQLQLSTVRDRLRGTQGFAGTVTDITDLKRAERQLIDSRILLAEAQKIAHLGNWIRTWNGATGSVFQYCSDEVYRILGLNPDDNPPERLNYMDLVHEDDRELLANALANAQYRQQPYTVEYRLQRPGGQERIVQERGIIKHINRPSSGKLHGTIQDITERRRAEQYALQVTNFDALTGLPNRKLFHQHLNQAMACAQHGAYMVALLILDLDNFKGINESLGHNHGDRLLRDVGMRIQQVLSPKQSIARLSGDEFGVILNQVRDSNEITWMVRQVRQVLKGEFLLGDHEIFCSACIGVSVYPGDADTADDLLQHAQSALRRSREQGRNSYQFFTADMNARALEHLLYENALRFALEREELELYYQPQVELVSGRIVGCEALLRWRHPDMGLISPTRFIPLAERTGLVVPIGLWAVRAACTQARRLLDLGLGPLEMSVNLSPQQLFQPGFTGEIENILTEVGWSPEYLKLELTEGSLLEDSAYTRLVLDRLHQLGVKISIDDFGTGYSSLSYLKRVPLDTIKIDRSFIQDLNRDSDDAAISRAIIALAKSLKIRVVAEGVENVEQWRFLVKHNCDEAQGNFIGEPLPAQPMLNWLQQYGQASTLAHWQSLNRHEQHDVRTSF